MKNKHKLFFTITAIIVLIDQFTKYLVPEEFSEEIIEGLFSIKYSQNTGAAFSILQGHQWIFIWLSIIVIGAIFYYYNQIPKKTLPVVGISSILAGALGNLIDRIFRGYVVDFINFSFWPNFNIADISLTFGAFILTYYILRYEK